jgi:hypothetical protein
MAEVAPKWHSPQLLFPLLLLPAAEMTIGSSAAAKPLRTNARPEWGLHGRARPPASHEDLLSCPWHAGRSLLAVPGDALNKGERAHDSRDEGRAGATLLGGS